MDEKPRIDVQRLVELEGFVNEALETGDTSKLVIMGQGEISPVIELTTDGGVFACKRLPRFDDAQKAADFRETLLTYIDRVEERQVKVAPTSLYDLPQADGSIITYAVQPRYPSETLATAMMADMNEAEAAEFNARVFAAMKRTVSPTLGLDAQLANWMLVDGELVYIDITTPFVRDAQGKEALDVSIFLRSLPWAVRGLVDMLFIKDTFDKFYDLRRVVVDYLGNLIKEGFADRLPVFIEQANGVIDDEPITREQVDAYYKEDAQMWSLIQKLRQTDRWWQRKIRRRVYPFLLPENIER